MRVAILYYPMLFQRMGGLQVQVVETTRALQDLGVDAELFDYRRHRLADFDIAHVFSAINGNHRIIEQASAEGLTVVLSTVLHPPWSRAQERRSRLLSWLAARFSGWSLSTTHQHLRRGLSLSDAVFALGRRERDMLVNGFRVSAAKVHVLPNGIKQAFFAGDETRFRERFRITGAYALNVASVSPYKNQMTALQALKGRLPLVVFGSCSRKYRPYLDRLQRFGGDWFHYFGELDNDDPTLPSAYAGAKVFVLPSRSEVYPIAAIEALAAGTPVIITRHNSLELGEGPNRLNQIDPFNVAAMRQEVETVMADPPSGEACRELVSHLTWRNVGVALKTQYAELLKAGKGRQG